MLLILTGLIPLKSAGHAVAKGLDVYLFLVGMMLISELARRQGVFDWLAVHAVSAAKGSSSRLFLLIYLVGVVVTVFLSNDATAVVLTPAVLAAVRAAEADPMPYLFSCAFIANAASFVLPISNPANLVVYAGAMPSLKLWLATFGLASLVSIVVTFIALRLVSARSLHGSVRPSVEPKPLSKGGKYTLSGIALLAVVLLAASALNIDLGLPAFIVGLLVTLAVGRFDVLRGVSWSVLPLVAGLFVIVEALTGVGALRFAVDALNALKSWPPLAAALASGGSIALISNLVNNLPSGLIAASAVHASHATGTLRDAVLIGVDLGPNLSVTGSLATILWLIAIRRDGLNVTFWGFLRWGLIVMPPTLLLALAASSVSAYLRMVK